MGFAVLAVRLLLVGVFVSAALAKLLERIGTRAAMVEFGVPRSLAPAAAVAVPVAELVLGVLLIPRPTSALAALGVIALLFVFTAGILLNVARGRTPNCNCFGSLHTAPADGRAAARNLLLAGLAAWAAAGSNLTSADEWALPLGLAVLAFAATWAVAGARRRPLQPGDPMAGGEERPLLFVFLAPDCAHCGSLREDVAVWRERAAFEVVVEEDPAIAARYRLPGTPSAVAITDGRVAAPVASGASAIRALAASLEELGSRPLSP